MRRKSKPRDKTQDKSGRVFSREKRAKEDAKKLRPRHKRGPWGDSVYLPSSLLGPGSVKPVSKTSISKAPVNEKPGEEKDSKERLQKVLARAGLASRRNAELLILEGAVTVNGRLVTELGTKVDPAKDKIKVKGRLIHTEVEPIYIALYKPKGVISALSDPEGRQHLGNLLHDVTERVFPVGRMDFNSEGLLLLTNDGALVERIQKSKKLPKIYMVKIKGHPQKEDLEFLKRGLFTAQGIVRFGSFELEQNLKNKSWLKLEVSEGAQLDLRELLNHRGILVDRIVRTAIGPLSIKGLNPGEYRFLSRRDLDRLLDLT